jgi:CubicO group peptidase (beta-lactamase class C family)
MPLIARCRVPKSLGSVTSRGENEVSPRSVGLTRAVVDGIWSAVEALYRTGMHPAIQLCVRRRGQVVVNRAIGHTSGNGPNDPPDAKTARATTETPFTIYSASKAVTAMVIHLLDQQHYLHVDDPVSEYIPEFSKHGKDRLTIEHVLTHRAGIPNVPRGEMNLENLARPGRILQIMCDAEPAWEPGRRLAYHAVSGGFVLAEIVRRATGKDIRTVLREQILAPLGFRWMNYGVKRSDIAKVAVNYFTGMPAIYPFANLVERVIGLDFKTAAELPNDPRFLAGIIPSANIVTNADELCRFFQLLLNGGELDGVRIFEPRTIHRATSEQSYLEFDFTLGLPLRYSMGFMLGGLGLYGPDTPHSFGHVGFMNIFAWADPERQVAVALTNSGKPLLHLGLYHIWVMMRRIAEAFPKEAPPRRVTKVLRIESRQRGGGPKRTASTSA